MRFREMRWHCDIEVVATLNGAGRKARITNISEPGVRLRGLDGVAVGNRVILYLLNRSIVAEVRWVRAGHIGLRFATRLRTSDVTIIRQGVHRPTGAGRYAHGLRELG
jgi:hypothetical protein